MLNDVLRQTQAEILMIYDATCQTSSIMFASLDSFYRVVCGLEKGQKVDLLHVTGVFVNVQDQ